MLFHETVVKEEAGQSRPVDLACGMRKVRLSDRREELTLVVVKGFGARSDRHPSAFPDFR